MTQAAKRRFLAKFEIKLNSNLGVVLPKHHVLFFEIVQLTTSTFPSFFHQKTRFQQQKYPRGCFTPSIKRFKGNSDSTAQSKGGRAAKIRNLG